MKKNLYKVVFFLLIANSLLSQNKITISGTVTDKQTKFPIPFAAVSITDTTTKKIIGGMMTDDNGKFNLKVPTIKLKLIVSFIGYKDFKMSLNSKENINIPITLTSNSDIIDDVVLESKQKFIQNKIDKKVVDVTQMPNASGSSASEILETLPSVNVDIDGNVSIRGNSNVTVLVDGKPSGLSAAEVLKQLPADGIQKIEIITNPTAKYDPEGTGGILNIILKKTQLIGFNGFATLSSGLGTFNKSYGTKINNTNSAGLNINYRNRSVNLFSNISWRSSERDRLITDDSKTKYKDSISKRDIVSDVDRKRDNISAKLGLDYYFNQNNTLTLSTTIRDGSNSSNMKEDNKYKEYKDIINPTHVNKNWLTRETSKATGGEIYYSLNHDIKFDDESKLITDISYGQENEFEQEDIFYTDRENADDLKPKKVDEKEKESKFRLTSDYTKEFGEDIKLEAGLRISLSDDMTDYTAKKKEGDNFVIDKNASNIFTYKEHIYASYGILMQSLKKIGFSYQLGLQVERVNISSVLENSKEDIPENNYFSIYPSINLEQKITDKDVLQLNYSRRVERPRPRLLNPFYDYSDPLNLFVGNPKLKPSYSNSLTLEYAHYWENSSLTSTIFYGYITDFISRISKTEGKVNIIKPVNFGYSSNYGGEITYSNRMLKWLNLNLTFEASVFKVSDNIEGEDLSMNTLQSSTKLNSIFNYSGYSMQMSMFYRNGFDFYQGYIYPMYRIDFGINKKFLANSLTLGIRVRDLLNSFKFSLDINRDKYTGYKNILWGSREIYLSLSYNFGNLKVRPKKRQDYQNGGDNEGGGIF